MGRVPQGIKIDANKYNWIVVRSNFYTTYFEQQQFENEKQYYSNYDKYIVENKTKKQMEKYFNENF